MMRIDWAQVSHGLQLCKSLPLDRGKCGALREGWGKAHRRREPGQGCRGGGGGMSTRSGSHWQTELSPRHLAKSITHGSCFNKSWPSEKVKVDIYVNRNQSYPSQNGTRGPWMWGTRTHLSDQFVTKWTDVWQTQHSNPSWAFLVQIDSNLREHFICSIKSLTTS